jgi:membrane protein
MGSGKKMIKRPTQMTVRAWWHALRDAGKAFQSKNLTYHASALTYFSVLSIFPALIVLISLLGVFGSQDSVDGLLRIVDQLGGQSAVDTLRPPIENIVTNSKAGLGLIIGMAVALWSASGYIGGFINAANEIWDVDEDRSFFKRRPLQLLITLVMTVAVAVILMSIVLTGPLVTAIGDEIGVGGTALTIFSIVKWPLTFAGVVLIIAFLYRTAPDTRHEGFLWILPGAIVATVLWLLGSIAFSFYVAHFGSYSGTYGSLAGAIVLLLWLYLTNIAVLFGAQFAAELERTANAVREATPPGQPVLLDPGARADAPHYSPPG